MGFSNRNTWSHSAINGGSQIIGYYANSSSNTEYIHSVTIELATGSGTFNHTDSEGNITGSTTAYGYAIYASLTINGITSDTAKITNVSNANSSGWADTSACTPITFTFSTSAPISANKSNNITIAWSGGAILCFDRATTITGVVTNNISLQATLSYDANGGSGSMTGHTVDVGTTITLKENEFIAPDSILWVLTLDYNGGSIDGTTTFLYNEFSSWLIPGEEYGLNPGETYIINDDITATASWFSRYQMGSAKHSNTYSDGYTITYNANGGKCNISSETMIDTTYYDFEGWLPKNSETGHLTADTYSIGGNSTVIAQYNTTLTDGSTTLPTPTKAGCTFVGWGTTTTSADIGTGTYTPTSDITLYAVWAHDLTIDPNGGYIRPGGPGYEYGTDIYDTITKKFIYQSPRNIGDMYDDQDNPGGYIYLLVRGNVGGASKEGYVQTGWNVTSGGGEVGLYQKDIYADTLSPQSTSQVDFTHNRANGAPYYVYDGNYDGNVTIQAQYRPNNYTINYIVNPPDGSNATLDITSFNHEASSISLATPSKISRYKFVGWNTNEDLSGNTLTTNNTYTVSELLNATSLSGWTNDPETTLYGVWKKKSGVHVYTNNAWTEATPYVYTNGAWKLATRKIYTNGSFNDES